MNTDTTKPDTIVLIHGFWVTPRRAFPQPDLFPPSRQGGHFAAWEEPELFSDELRAAFRSLR